MRTPFLPRSRPLLVCLAALAFGGTIPLTRAAEATPPVPPAPKQWWQEVDTGPFISDTFRSAVNGPVLALKGLAIKLGHERNVTAVFDTELLAWRTAFDGNIAL